MFLLPLAVNFQNPLLWAVVIGWIISVILHEFAHGLAAHLGGDYTIRERGGLTLNPIQYIDPLFSILLPLLFLLMGGIPLPGGVTYIRTDLLRSRAWRTAVSLAGPAMNFLIFLACVIPLHPVFGWVDGNADPQTWTNFQIFLGAMALLQIMAVILNLIPIPPLDGFNAISPYLPPDIYIRITSLPGPFLLVIIFLLASRFMGYAMIPVVIAMHKAGYGSNIEFMWTAFEICLRGTQP
jgi:Zn-dependent protease